MQLCVSSAKKVRQSSYNDAIALAHIGLCVFKWNA